MEECNLDLILFFLSALLLGQGRQIMMIMDLKKVFKKVVVQIIMILLLNNQEILEKKLMVLKFLSYNNKKLNFEEIL